VCAKEIEVKGALEKILRACVDDVKNEIAKKRQQAYTRQSNVYYCKNAGGNKGGAEGGQYEDKSLT